MHAEPTRASRLGTAARAFGVLCAVAFVALLGYGIIAQAPDTTIDDALAALVAAVLCRAWSSSTSCAVTSSRATSARSTRTSSNCTAPAAWH